MKYKKKNLCGIYTGVRCTFTNKNDTWN